MNKSVSFNRAVNVREYPSSKKQTLGSAFSDDRKRNSYCSPLRPDQYAERNGSPLRGESPRRGASPNKNDYSSASPLKRGQQHEAEMRKQAFSPVTPQRRAPLDRVEQ